MVRVCPSEPLGFHFPLPSGSGLPLQPLPPLYPVSLLLALWALNALPTFLQAHEFGLAVLEVGDGTFLVLSVPHPLSLLDDVFIDLINPRFTDLFLVCHSQITE